MERTQNSESECMYTKLLRGPSLLANFHIPMADTCLAYSASMNEKNKWINE